MKIIQIVDCDIFCNFVIIYILFFYASNTPSALLINLLIHVLCHVFINLKYTFWHIQGMSSLSKDLQNANDFIMSEI